MSNRRTRTLIQWRVKSQANFLPPADLRWSEFCTIDEPGKHTACLTMILAGLELHSKSEHNLFEFRLKP